MPPSLFAAFRTSLPSGLLLALSLLLVSCATIESTTTQYVGAPHYPPTKPDDVEILRKEPTKPHVRLGEVVIDASVEPAPPITEIEGRLRKDAASIGADAAVVVLDRVQPVAAYVEGPWWGRGVDEVSGRKLVGVAIKYRE